MTTVLQMWQFMTVQGKEGHAGYCRGLAVLALLTQGTETKIKAFPASCCVIKMNFIMPR